MCRKFLYLFALICLLLPKISFAAFNFDLGLEQNDIKIASDQLVAGKITKVTARVHNYGSNDAKANVSFYLGDQILSQLAAIQILAGTYEDVWTELKIPASDFSLRVAVQAVGVTDEQPANNEQQTGLLSPVSATPPAEPKSTTPVLTASPEGGVNSIGIIYQSAGWQRYKFQTDIPSDLVSSYTYFWDFGDGSQSVKSLVVHRYRRPGVYQIKLSAENSARQIFTAETTLVISWFNPGNYKMWSLVSSLCVIILVLLWSLKEKNFLRLERITKNILIKLKNKSAKKYEGESQKFRIEE